MTFFQLTGKTFEEIWAAQRQVLGFLKVESITPKEGGVTVQGDLDRYTTATIQEATVKGIGEDGKTKTTDFLDKRLEEDLHGEFEQCPKCDPGSKCTRNGITYAPTGLYNGTAHDNVMIEVKLQVEGSPDAPSHTPEKPYWLHDDLNYRTNKGTTNLRPHKPTEVTVRTLVPQNTPAQNQVGPIPPSRVPTQPVTASTKGSPPQPVTASTDGSTPHLTTTAPPGEITQEGEQFSTFVVCYVITDEQGNVLIKTHHDANVRATMERAAFHRIITDKMVASFNLRTMPPDVRPREGHDGCIIVSRNRGPDVAKLMNRLVMKLYIFPTGTEVIDAKNHFHISQSLAKDKGSRVNPLVVRDEIKAQDLTKEHFSLAEQAKFRDFINSAKRYRTKSDVKQKAKGTQKASGTQRAPRFLGATKKSKSTKNPDASDSDPQSDIWASSDQDSDDEAPSKKAQKQSTEGTPRHAPSTRSKALPTAEAVFGKVLAAIYGKCEDRIMSAVIENAKDYACKSIAPVQLRLLIAKLGVSKGLHACSILRHVLIVAMAASPHCVSTDFQNLPSNPDDPVPIWNWAIQTFTRIRTDTQVADAAEALMGLADPEAPPTYTPCNEAKASFLLAMVLFFIKAVKEDRVEDFKKKVLEELNKVFSEGTDLIAAVKALRSFACNGKKGGNQAFVNNLTEHFLGPATDVQPRVA